ncbi:hypothetical protein OIE68_46000 [Nocardia vinacea]|uniref:hypothetical protein n=1 Tax=Nocardia vinacea TaxID=96468 RepID=UPI002E0F1151|nr:hypothetical protein OIE68_46000 [Nocardia vinacea]
MNAPEFAFNGIDGSTGAYLQAPQTIEALAKAIRNEPEDLEDKEDVNLRCQSAEDHFGAVFGVDLEDLEKAGWGVIFADGTSADVVKALSPLLKLRREQAGSRYCEYRGESAPRPLETKRRWLARHKMGPGPANPEKVPYYLLLVGDPAALPYQFQYQLDVQYAVGRISFETTHQYSRYAQSVVAAERGERAKSKKITLFGPRNKGDRATKLSAEQLVAPLEADLSKSVDWQVDMSIGEDATKDCLAELLSDTDGPSVLFTASHGMCFPNTDVRQRNNQGALLCQDWPGPLSWGNKPISSEFYFAAADVPAGVRPEIVFSFACFGAGTPHRNDFPHLALGGPHDEITPFVAQLPVHLLTAPTMSTLAFVGHVERAWSCSFSSPDVSEQREPFTSCLQAIMAGWRVGHTVEVFNQRYADLSTDLSEGWYRQDHYGERFLDSDLVRLWTANNDARSYVVIGDPAVRAPSAIGE